LIEVVLAMALISLVLFALLSVLPGSFFTMPKAEHQLSANLMADEILDSYTARPFSQLQPGIYPLAARKLEDGTEVSAELEIASGAGRLASTLRLLTLRLSWSDRQNRKRLVRHRRVAHLQR
jgi:hypothetical protein